MVNLFQSTRAAQGSLTAALLALLEHSDRALLDAFLHEAGIPPVLSPDAPLSATFPAPDGLPGAGEIAGVRVITQAPGEPWNPPSLPDGDPPTLVITLSGAVPEGARTLTWEQVDRWLAARAEAYDPESRTGFLIQQFRAYLHEVGIAYFEGFAPGELANAAQAVGLLSAFFGTAEKFFTQFGRDLATVRTGAAQVRQSRAEDLLAGYCYRDYAGTALGPDSFLRVAFHLPAQAVQVSLWLVPGGALPAHARLREALLQDESFVERLQGLGEEPLLWLWSPGGEERISLDQFHPNAIANLNWVQYQVGLQSSLPFTRLSAEGSVRSIVALSEGLLAALAPVLTPLLH